MDFKDKVIGWMRESEYNAEDFKLNQQFDRKMDEIISEVNKLDDPPTNNDDYYKLISFDQTINDNIIDMVIKKYFEENTKLHSIPSVIKKMNPDCNRDPKNTYQEEIEHSRQHNIREPTKGSSGDCQMRLNNVHVLEYNRNNYVIKRMTRFSDKDSDDFNFIGSECDMNNKKKAICEHKELFYNLILSYYLREIGGDKICPKIYGVIIVKKKNIPAKNYTVKNEIFIISEKMEKTLEDLMESTLSNEAIKNLIISIVRNRIFMSYNRVHPSLIKKYANVLMYEDGSEIYNNSDIYNKYLYFYDCKQDNIMIDNQNFVRIIDIDGVMLKGYNEQAIIQLLPFCLLSTYIDNGYLFDIGGDHTSIYKSFFNNNNSIIRICNQLSMDISSINVNELCQKEKIYLDQINSNLKLIETKFNELKTQIIDLDLLEQQNQVDNMIIIAPAPAPMPVPVVAAVIAQQGGNKNYKKMYIKYKNKK
jgi:hypothetical protein